MAIFKKEYEIKDKDEDKKEKKKIKVVWYIDYYFEGKRIREAIGPNKKLAEKSLAIRKAEIAQGKYDIQKLKPSITFNELAEIYIEYAKANKKSWKRDVVSLNSLFKFFKTMRLKSITSFHVEKYKLKRVEGVSPATVNRDLACMKHMFNLAIKWGKTTKNPVKEVKMFKVKNRRLRFLSEEEVQRLIECCSEQLRSVVIIAIYTGMRKSEILNLGWSDIDFSRRLIMIDDSKSGSPRQIPINDLLMKTLLTLRSHSSSHYIFLNKHEKPYKDVRTAFNTVLKKARLKGFTFHDLRRTFASHLVMSGVDLVTVKELLGHKTIQITVNRYSYLSEKHKLKAVNILERRLSLGHSTDTMVKETEVFYS